MGDLFGPYFISSDSVSMTGLKSRKSSGSANDASKFILGGADKSRTGKASSKAAGAHRRSLMGSIEEQGKVEVIISNNKRYFCQRQE